MLTIMAGLTGQTLSPLTWYLTRAGGLTLYLLLWASLMLGLGVTTKAADRLTSRSVVWSLHTFVTQLAYGFLGLHLISLLADSHVPFTVVDILLPFSSNAVEPWTGLGVVGMYVLLIIGISGPARRFIDFKAWKMIHLLSFPLFLLALLHGVKSGTDTPTSGIAAMYLLTTLSACWLTLYRLITRSNRGRLPVPSPGSPSLDRFAPPETSLPRSR